MIVVVNGKDMELAGGATIFDLLAEREVAPETVVVEMNGEILPGENFGSTQLKEGDRLEVLRFVGGG